MIKKSELSLRICDLEDTVECLSKKIARLERKTKNLEGEKEKKGVKISK